MSSTTPNRLRRATPLSEDADRMGEACRPPSESDVTSDEPTSESSQNTDSLSPTEARSLRNEKLKAIRAAIDAGHYDSDELLAKALNRMRQAIENEAEPQ